MKLFIKILLLFFFAINTYAQRVVEDVGKVKRPLEGKMYFDQTKKTLFVYDGSEFAKIWQKQSEPVIIDDKWMIIDEPPEANVIIKKELVGLYKEYMPIYKITFDDYKARSYILKDGSWSNTGINIYQSNYFLIKPGLKLSDITANIIDEVTANDGLDASPFSFSFKNINEPVVVGTESKKPLLLHVWGNGGQTFVSDQGTQRAERYMLSQPQFRDQLPFYGYDHPAQIVQVPNYQNGKEIGKKNVTVTVDYLMDVGNMEKTVDYVLKAKLSGFAFLWYADDAILREWRRSFVALPNKKGLKMTYNLGTFGSGHEQYPAESEYKRSINTIVSHLDEDFYLKVDGKPVLSFMIQNFDIEQNTEGLKRAMETIRRINEQYGKEIYWVLNCDFYEQNNWYKNNGFEAITGYYLYGNYKDNDFKEVVNISSNWNSSHTAAGRVVAPLITCGLDSRARKWYEHGDAGNNFYKWETVYTHLPTLIKNTVEFMNSTEKVKIAYVVHADEHTEQGLGFLPRKLKNGSIDDRVVKIFEGAIN